MKLLHDKHLPFGISACYTSANIDSIASGISIHLRSGRPLHLTSTICQWSATTPARSPAESGTA
ncbi:MAG: hypothetical protein ACLUZQ_08725 [Butyricicoccus sp.]